MVAAVAMATAAAAELVYKRQKRLALKSDAVVDRLQQHQCLFAVALVAAQRNLSAAADGAAVAVGAVADAFPCDCCCSECSRAFRGVAIAANHLRTER